MLDFLSTMDIKATDLTDLSKCKKCPLLGKDHVPAIGNEFATLMIIGQSPGELEVLERKPFVGPSGELLNFMLDEAGLTREEVYITNLLKCRPPQNRKGYKDEHTNCFGKWLFNEIKLVNPGLILLLGKDAHTIVLPKRMEFRHLAINESKNRSYLSSYHPSYFLRIGRVDKFVEVGGFVKNIVDRLDNKV